MEAVNVCGRLKPQGMVGYPGLATTLSCSPSDASSSSLLPCEGGRGESYYQNPKLLLGVEVHSTGAVGFRTGT